jgi:hypothetical protein
MILPQDVDFLWPDITIGNTIGAVQYAIKNNTRLLLSGYPAINSYETLPDLVTPKEATWASLVYEAYNMSLVPFSGKIRSIRISPDIIQVFTNSEKKYIISYENINLFSLNNISGLELNFDKVFCYNKVIDWFDVRTGGEDKLSFDIPRDSVIQSIESYPSSRRDGQVHYDLYSISHLSDSQIINYEYSDTYIRFMIQRCAKDKEIKLELWKRDVGRVCEVVPKQMIENIKWLGDTHETYQR